MICLNWAWSLNVWLKFECLQHLAGIFKRCAQVNFLKHQKLTSSAKNIDLVFSTFFWSGGNYCEKYIHLRAKTMRISTCSYLDSRVWTLDFKLAISFLWSQECCISETEMIMKQHKFLYLKISVYIWCDYSKTQSIQILPPVQKRLIMKRM